MKIENLKYSVVVRINILYQKIRGIKYSLFSTAKVNGSLNKLQPVLFTGRGRVLIGKNVQVGVINSPFLWNTYAHIEPRKPNAIIQFGNDVWLNNNAVLIADSAGIFIGDRTIAGYNLEIIDSDFHNLDPEKRFDQDFISQPVYIEENVFLGSNVKILKGVTIGKNSVVASGSVVTKSLPANVIAAGNPARVIKEF